MTKENLYEVEFETLNKKEITPFESKAAILNSKLDVSVILGKCKKNIKDIVNLQEGDIIFLDKTIDENLDIYVNDKYVASGESIKIEDKISVRIIDFDLIHE